VKPIAILPDTPAVFLDNTQLSWEELVAFSFHDGFNLPGDFMEFFRRYPAEVRENELEAIYWRLE
jgi:hypothetical protein